jgi:hypothetical protein
MAASGSPREAIWNETGWFQGVDGKWRFEIDDSSSRMKVDSRGRPDYTTPHERNVKGDIRLKDALDHPAFFDAYPHVAEYPFTIDAPRGSLGGFDPTTKQIYAVRDPLSMTMDTVTRRESPNQLAVVLHEAGGHGVQDAEGFAKGAAPDLFTQQKEAEMARTALSFRRELQDQPKELGPAARENAVVDRYRKNDIMDWLPSREVRDIAADVHGNPNEQLEALMKLYATDRRTSAYSPREMYRRTAGEVEARNVQRRMGMSAEERRAKPPWETQDVPDAQQILRELYE